MVFEQDGRRDTTRDILYVKGKLNDEEVHIFVNQWPSRRDGDTETRYKRIKAAETVLDFKAKIETRNELPRGRAHKVSSGRKF